MKPTAKSLTLLGAVLIVTAPLTPGTARADEHEEARRLREAGDILPLEEVIARVRAEHPGRIIETELESEGGRYVYEIEVLEESGEVTEFKIDARSGERIRYEERDRDSRARSEDRELAERASTRKDRED